MSPPLRFGPDYQETVCLRGGEEVLLRHIRPGDEELIRRGFEGLSDDSRYRRFLMAKRALSDRELALLTATDGEDHVAIGAGIEREAAPDDPLGVARFVRTTPGGIVAEAAVAVVDAWHGRGLGRLLFERLAAAAHERGIRRFRVEMLASNLEMRALTRILGPRDRLEVHPGVLAAEFALPDPAETARLRESAAYRALALHAAQDS